MSSEYDALDDFAGPGGWDEGARMVGLTLYGVDYDKAACETARAEGHHREQADVTTHESPAWARGRGHVSSPSCTLFSMAGSGVGRLVLDVLCDGVVRILGGEDVEAVRAKCRDAIYPTALAEAERANAKRKPEKRREPERVEVKARLDAKVAALVLEPARRIMELDPEWVALEQVPAVLPLWQVYARELRARRWSCYAVVLNSADYGVPQTRKRAIFGGSRVRAVLPPLPTHAEHPQDDDLFGASLAKWVTFSEAMQAAGFWEWTGDELIIPARGKGMDERHGTRPPHPTDQVAPTVISKARSWVIDRRTNSKAAGGGMAPTVPVPVTRPATTVVGSFKPDVIAAPGYRTETSRQNAPGSVSVSVCEAGVLQSFRPDYAWKGSRAKQYEQVGNAIPPLLAAHVLAAVTGRSEQLLAYLQERAA